MSELEPDRLYRVTFEKPDGWQKVYRNLSGRDAKAIAETLPDGTRLYFTPEWVGGFFE